ncbi:hypothetical protein FKW77_008664 [Venturia effusa]|uniref:Uncharacterized protein n=1 Tax=Venturia effusa TaxID=50376 RepID=A0A517LCT1_9PEZI|nr:hypothetical protein FKW77_008664 [Venturia effusa]
MSGYTPVPLYPGQIFHPNPSFQSQQQTGTYNQHHQYGQIGQDPQYGYVNQQHNHQQFQNQHLHNPYQHLYPSQSSFNPSVNTAHHSQTSFQPNHQPSQEFHPLISDHGGKKQPEPFVQEILQYKQPKRRRADYLTTVMLFSVWAFLTMSCVVLLYFALVASQDDGEAGANVTGTEIGGVIMLAAPFILLATILNEVLIDRAWRRVVHAALGRNAETYSNEKMSRHLRAANLEWLNIMKRLWTHELSWQDFKSMASYVFLRWGTAISIASIQLCVSWDEIGAMDENGIPMYAANKRRAWLVVPMLVHSFSTFGALAVWGLPPWALFSSRYDELGLLERYRPYLERVPGGSIVKYENVARNLNPGNRQTYDMFKEHTPGGQIIAKLKGIWFGLLLMALAPTAAALYTWQTQSHGEDGMIRSGIYRFGFHLVFLAQNIFYILALDFAIWNITLEGFCRGPKTKPNKSLRHLGYSSGLMLFFRACRQRRPFRAAIFMWMFWFQAVLVRCFTALYAYTVVIGRYSSKEDRKAFWDPEFWLGYGILSMALALPLFFVWLFTPFQAPIGEQDGWRWAKLAQTALREDGFYGVRDVRDASGQIVPEAAWGMNVRSFRSVGKETLR